MPPSCGCPAVLVQTQVNCTQWAAGSGGVDQPTAMQACQPSANQPGSRGVLLLHSQPTVRLHYVATLHSRELRATGCKGWLYGSAKQV
mmetsp:Transcript_17697/g.30336  ORF Transcript_17697/g.30336 Transcript_17697/m.30336 type:complete len:88 (+) Transcript_17697:299-562(+)